MLRYNVRGSIGLYQASILPCRRDHPAVVVALGQRRCNPPIARGARDAPLRIDLVLHLDDEPPTPAHIGFDDLTKILRIMRPRARQADVRETCIIPEERSAWSIEEIVAAGSSFSGRGHATSSERYTQTPSIIPIRRLPG